MLCFSVKISCDFRCTTIFIDNQKEIIGFNILEPFLLKDSGNYFVLLPNVPICLVLVNAQAFGFPHVFCSCFLRGPEMFQSSSCCQAIGSFQIWLLGVKGQSILVASDEILSKKSTSVIYFAPLVYHVSWSIMLWTSKTWTILKVWIVPFHFEENFSLWKYVSQ